ncbi:MAG: acyl-CoA dehydrogenase family protein [Dehalococcoidia bacterium]
MESEAKRYLAAIDAIAPVVRRDAALAEDLAHATPAMAEAFVEHGLYRLWVPRSLDGAELDLPASLEVFEAASRLDGSAGWLVTIGTGGGLFAAFMEASAAEEVFRPKDALIAGSGTPSGTADIVDGGYRATGTWRFASGAYEATWFTANCVVRRDGNAVLDDRGEPLIRAMAFPADEVEVIETWFVTGLRGTGSHDFSVYDAFVPAARTFSVFTGKPREPGPLYRYPFMAIAELSFASVALGIARHALDEAFALAGTKMPSMSPGLMREDPAVQVRFAEAEAIVRSARAFFYETAATSWEQVVGGQVLTWKDEALVQLASVHATAAAARAVDLLYEAAGTTPLFTQDTLGRCWRDVHALTQHTSISPRRYLDAGRRLLEGGAGP